MKKKNRISLVGFLLSFSALNTSAPTTQAANTDVPSPTQTAHTDTSSQTIEERLSRLTGLIRQQEQQLSEADRLSADQLTARGFADGDDRGWRRSRHSGWFDGDDGFDFRNADPWRNSWRDGGRFFNWND